MTPELMIVMAGLYAQRDRKGKRWCREKGIGAIRKAIGPENVEPISTSIVPRVREYEENRRQAAGILVTACKVCARCPLGREQAACGRCGNSAP